MEELRKKNAYPVEDLIIVAVDESFAPEGTLLDDQQIDGKGLRQQTRVIRICDDACLDVRRAVNNPIGAINSDIVDLHNLPSLPSNVWN
jgi:hypothetical protein